MIDVVHTKQGKSFRGLVAYLLEGEKDAANPERVAWTETRNLATGNPMMAARVMAATALDQDRLKKDAGVKNTGRKSANHVLHYTLSWTEDQGVSREEMMRAVDGSLAVLGETAGQKGGRGEKKGRVALRDHFANEHQVLVVAHEDTDKPHVHVVVNRVHPRHGVMLPTSKDFLALSRWAERYELETTGLIVDQRAINNASRAEGKMVYADKRVARDVFEVEAAANDNRPAVARVREEQRRKDAELAKGSAAQRARRKEERTRIEQAHRDNKSTLRASLDKEINTAKRQVQAAFAQQWAMLHHEHRAATAAFERGEATLAGKAMNALRALLSLKAPVNVLWSQGSRKAVLEDAQEAQRRELRAKEQRAAAEAERKARALLRRRLVELGQSFTRERLDLIVRHAEEAAELKARWRAREQERRQAWEEHRKAMAALPPEKCFGAQMIEPDARTKRAVASEQRRKDQLRSQLGDAFDRGHEDDRGR